MGWHMSLENKDLYLENILTFLNDIGIPTEVKPLPDDTRMPGVRLEYGGLAIDPDKLCYVGDLLHEAGHIACMAPSLRKEAYADAGDDMGEEIAAQAWSYAAALAAEVPPEIVFHKEGYFGSSDALLRHYQGGGVNGAPLLQWYDLTTSPMHEEKGPDYFPAMRSWIRSMDDPTKYWQKADTSK